MAESTTEPTTGSTTGPSVQSAGPGRVLALAYGFFTLAAGARSSVQLLTDAGQAPVAYGLSAIAAVIYLLGTIAVIRADQVTTTRTEGRRRWVWACTLCCIELTGVVTVGLASMIAPQAFPDATVWSGFGSGYGWVPLALPIAGLAWLRSRRTQFS